MPPKYFQFIKPTKNSNDCNFSLIFALKYTNKRGSSTLLKIRYMTHELYMRKALEEASLAEEEGEIPVGAIVVCKGKIIARAHNQTERLNDVTAHAEMVAITMAAPSRSWRKIPERMHPLCHPGTLYHVCRSNGLGPTWGIGIRSFRLPAGIQPVKPGSASPPHQNYFRYSRARMQ